MRDICKFLPGVSKEYIIGKSINSIFTNSCGVSLKVVVIELHSGWENPSSSPQVDFALHWDDNCNHAIFPKTSLGC